jgi:hypothetical protein
VIHFVLNNGQVIINDPKLRPNLSEAHDIKELLSSEEGYKLTYKDENGAVKITILKGGDVKEVLTPQDRLAKRIRNNQFRMQYEEALKGLADAYYRKYA